MADIEIDTKPFLHDVDLRDADSGICVGWFKLATVPAVGDFLQVPVERKRGEPWTGPVRYVVRGREWDLTATDPAEGTVELTVAKATDDFDAARRAEGGA